ncbi:zinc finger (C3HC4-type RING finger) family protein [Striga hermonthica]|uniref:RBR-type E3 ubiquitin transferase n=1 Tax=Striga hermonthica TaxID=68872 RepID=A0A9N7N860_STRHE|nr:zinc finger (C3HC4-type RING finger) family protein [Striga hermonthica]
MSAIPTTAAMSLDDLQEIAAEQRRELISAQALDSDLDFAFNLQLQEAITASLSIHEQPPDTTPAADAPNTTPKEDGGDVPRFSDLLSEEVLRLEQQLGDFAMSEAEFERVKDDLRRRIHDRQVAVEISKMPDEEWEDWGDEFERPFGEGTSKGDEEEVEVFRIYFKGLVEKQGTPVGGIGVAICNSSDELLFELRKPLVGSGASSRQCAEAQALVEALSAALDLGLETVIFYCDYYPIYRFVTGRWLAKSRKVSALIHQVKQLRERFDYCQPYLVARNDIKFAFKLAREAVTSQASKPQELNCSGTTETCVICTEDTNIDHIFPVDNCLHRYCFSCMKQHVEVKLLHGLLPTCPHEGCKTELKLDSCSKFLTPRLIEIMSQRIKEASIPVTDKVYCPFPKCSALMSKGEVLEFSKKSIKGVETFGARRCIKCNGYFCIDCKVPWHYNLTCSDYKEKHPYPLPEEAKLKNLAETNLWRQCLKCNHMIELSAGCYHMTCRCGHEFCYNCGAAWENKKQTCSCPLWDEDYILDDDDDEEDFDDEDEFDDEYDEDEDEELT